MLKTSIETDRKLQGGRRNKRNRRPKHASRLGVQRNLCLSSVCMCVCRSRTFGGGSELFHLHVLRGGALPFVRAIALLPQCPA